MSHENEIIWSQIISIFKRYFINQGQRGGSSEPPEAPLDPPLHGTLLTHCSWFCCFLLTFFSKLTFSKYSLATLPGCQAVRRHSVGSDLGQKKVSEYDQEIPRPTRSTMKKTHRTLIRKTIKVKLPALPLRSR